MIRKTLFTFIIITVISYVVFCIVDFNAQENVKYMRRSDVIDVLNQNHEYFDSLAEYYRFYESHSVLYDLSNQSFVSQISEEDEILSELFQKYSFNWLQKDGDYLSILYNRPFDHNVVIGIVYDYDEKKWASIYNHNYERCATGHFNGYRFYDLIFN